MTDAQAQQIDALVCCTFSPASFEKRFVRSMAGRRLRDQPLSDKAAVVLDRLAHSYRRQIGRCMATEPCAWCAGAPVRRPRAATPTEGGEACPSKS